MTKPPNAEDKMIPTKTSNDEEKERPTAIEEESGATIPQDDVCQKAPEWAEHARLDDDDEPCDDGRSGNLARKPKKD
jgi:hypothetical protein